MLRTNILKEHSQFGSEKKLAVILQTTKRKQQFRSTFGFYEKNLYDLRNAGYEIPNININNFINELESLEDSSVGFLWVRMHGEPESMDATEELTITTENCHQVFKCLSRILTDTATIFLDSCSTGSLDKGINNIQFAFAKLTLNKPDVQIVAPLKNMHMSYFSILEDQTFGFEIIEKPRSYQSMCVILGKQTKEIISDACKNNMSLESIHDELVESLQLNLKCEFLNKFREENKKIMFGADFDLNTMLVNAINSIHDSDEALSVVSKLVEVFHANPNQEDGYIFHFSSLARATPLSAAIFYENTKIAEYLLNQGANLFYIIKERTLLDYFNDYYNQGKRPADDFDMDRLVINMRKKRENDDSNILNVISDHVNSNKRNTWIKQSIWAGVNNTSCDQLIEAERESKLIAK